jgi:hypothetical protein
MMPSTTRAPEASCSPERRVPGKKIADKIAVLTGCSAMTPKVTCIPIVDALRVQAELQINDWSS